MVRIDETIHTTDATPSSISSPVKVAINENIRLSDALQSNPNSVVITLNEPVHTADSLTNTNLSPVRVQINESVSVADAVH
jgi:hypothetical protein